MAKHP